ncbi:MAG: hypothetical protein MRJ65_12010 [Candidatus Brocadiaceae bacterium]|nr:hypothetical protein [Candidatus Brocadiaceae bacterium]
MAYGGLTVSCEPFEHINGCLSLLAVIDDEHMREAINRVSFGILRVNPFTNVACTACAFPIPLLTRIPVSQVRVATWWLLGICPQFPSLLRSDPTD